uniref:Afadin, adherens junction formation factor a n=1 Tax=Gasterosteus aculeatus aculeatus TaxID=481459 RepID=A0AAQ4RDQ6_GASAC
LSREEERRKLADIINHWNANRLDLFEISRPTEDLEFHGVMRFYFQDRVAGNFATKCIRVSSTATTQDVIETLAEKFRPDMRMLSSPKYSLYEVHVSGERQLDLDEKPLVVQLNWNKDDREGRFVLKNENDILPKKSQSNGPEKEKDGVIQNFKRTLSKKEKKKEKKREKEFARIPDGDEHTENSCLAAEVYKDMPETSFTRTISNPEVVMKRRRQQKLEKRMQEFMSSDGRPDSGGTLRIYADSLKPNIPYKTILLSTRDTADFAVGEALEKYGLEKENPREYCISRVTLLISLQLLHDKSSKEVILDDAECPLQIFRDWPADRGALVFQLKKRPPDYQGRKGRKVDDHGLQGSTSSLPPEKLPYLVELSPDGSDSRDKPKLYRLQQSVTEVGSDCTEDGAIQLLGPGILPHHCNLMHSEGMVTVTPHGPDADTFVDGQRLNETTVLRSGSTLQFGSVHVFKFVDPMFDQGGKRETAAMMRSRHKSGSVPETTFDLQGDVHSGAPLPTSKHTLCRRMQVVSRPGPLCVHPAEDTFLSAIINYTNSSTVHFKLSPTYVLYMACRYVLSPSYRPDMSPSERTHKVIAIVNKMVSMMEGVIQVSTTTFHKQKNIAGALAFWMANASELLNFVKQDRDLSRVTLDAQDVLAHLVQMAFKYLVHCLQADLNNYMPAFVDDPEEHNPQRPKIEDVLHTLTGAMSLLRRCRVNAALTIQLFSQLFHFINMWLFNKLVTDTDSGLCCHYWGAILRQQLSHIEAWAEKQGLELAADCHLSRIVQATTLLTMDKYSMQDVKNIHNTCFKLNSLQLHALMTNYHCAPDEPYIPPELIDHVVAVAENTADELARSDGREVQLQEDPDLQLPFLLPEDGYSCDVVRSLPNGLQDFLEPLLQRGFCRLVPHPRSPGTWTVHFEGADCDSHFSAPMRKDPEVVTVTLKKHNGMGLSIVAAKGAGQEKLGIYVKSVVKGGAADVDGRLAAGDQLLSVDGRSLVGLSQERAAELMTRTGSVVTLEVAKQGAIYHGLATLLNQPSPMMQRASDRGRDKNGKLRPKSEGFELYNNSVQNGSPESPQGGWDSYPEPKKMSGEDRLFKNRADHRSSPNVANQGQSPAGKAVYPGGPGTKITSVSTGNLCDEPSPPRPEAYPIPTQTYPREYFTIPASKSQDRVVVVPGQGRPLTAGVSPGVGGPDHWASQPQVSSSVESSTSSQEHLNFSASSSSSNKTPNQKTGPGRWKTPNAPHAVPQHPAQTPSRSDLPPPPPPPPAAYPDAYDAYEPQPELPLPPPPTAINFVAAQQAADRKKREEQQRWYEKEKARLEEERERKRREQERKLGQIRANPVMPVQPHNNGMDTVIRDLLPQQQPRTIERRDLQYITISKDPTSSDSLSPDPWKRDAREKAEKQQQLHIVDLLDKEIQELQSKPERTAEESDRLRKLMLEWQFQKRLQESKHSDEDEEEEDDEEVDTMMIMQRLEAEKRARDEERRRKQQLEEIRKREAEERAKQEEERRWRDEVELTNRLSLPQRRQEEVYYTRLEAERRRQHEEAERKLLTPDEPAGLYRPPLPRDYQPPTPNNPTNTPPPPPQRNTSYLKTQVASPDTLYTAKFVSYAGDEEDEEEATMAGSGGGHQSGQVKLSATRKSYGDLPASASPNPCRPQPPPTARKPRPLSDGIFLSGSFQPPYNSNSTGPPLPAKPSSVPPGGFKGFNSYTGNSAGVVGSGEVYNDPRDKCQEQENSIPGGNPESMTFKERQRLFSQGKEVSNKVKASRKLMELENELNTKQ